MPRSHIRRLTAIVILFLLASLFCQSAFGQTLDSSRSVASALDPDRELIVVWKEPQKAKRSSAAIVSAKETAIAPHISLLRTGSTQEAEQMMQQLTAHPDVDFVEPNKKIYISESNRIAIPNDPYYPKQWSLAAMHVPEAWSLLQPTRKSVVVAVIDTGIDPSHPDLAGRILEGKDYVSQSKLPLDENGHGTHVAGIIAARTDNGIGIAGLAGKTDVMILPLKVLDKDGVGTVANEIQAIYDAVEMGADVINLSLGDDQPSRAEREAIRYAKDHDVIVVAAAGNQAAAVEYPAAYPETLAVGASDANDQPAGFSNYGNMLDVVAPGMQILSTVPDQVTPGGYETMSGTSMATAAVSALAALLKSQAPERSSGEIEEIIKQSAVDIGPPGRDIYSGYGRIDFALALQNLRGDHTPTPEPSAYTMTRLKSDPALFHQLLTAYSSQEILVRSADGRLYTWAELLSKPQVMAGLLTDSSTVIEISQ
ncbi:S8 family serine peptidase [Brevibacillus sp. B_LB10_24]|uniref:S8 family serine peptidase n=1 Tax=Brevibacillus sp. B_LB10_24 TaxID=3380645 RepID=UPI0038BAB58B